MKKFSITFLSRLLTIYSMLVFSMSSVLPAMNPDLTDFKAVQAELKQQLDQMNLDPDKLKKEVAQIQEEFKRAHPAGQQEIGIAQSFKNIGWKPSIAEIKSPFTDHRMNIELGLQGTDLSRITLFGSEIGLDYLLHKYLSQKYLATLVKNLIDKKEPLIALLQSCSMTSGGNLVNDEHGNNLINFFNTECMPEFSLRQVQLELLLRIFVYFIGSECKDRLENFLFPPKENGFGFLKAVEEADTIDKKMREIHKNGVRNVTIPISSLLLLFIKPYCGIWPSSAEIGPLLSILDPIFGLDASEHTRTIEWEESKVLRFLRVISGWHHNFMDSRLFLAIKKLSVLARFIKQSHNFYQQHYSDYIPKNSEKLLHLLTQLPNNKGEAHKTVKEFLNEETKIPFIEWLRFKNSCFRWTKFWIDFFLFIPAVYEGCMFLYQAYNNDQIPNVEGTP